MTPPVTLSRADRLCALAGHTLDAYDGTSDEPGAIVCREEDCASERIVALHLAAEAVRQGMASLAVNCPDADCECGVPAVMQAMKAAADRVYDEFSRLLSEQFPDFLANAEAELIVVGP